ncbi:hypothetical protein J7J00_15425 [Bacillus sp. ISL-4]|nr:hypothetical protein [Bacillus sp. ISL-4]MBT2666890.1 hypothetical protein [Bacillus sp. ISL-4]
MPQISNQMNDFVKPCFLLIAKEYVEGKNISEIAITIKRTEPNVRIY